MYKKTLVLLILAISTYSIFSSPQETDTESSEKEDNNSILFIWHELEIKNINLEAKNRNLAKKLKEDKLKKIKFEHYFGEELYSGKKYTEDDKKEHSKFYKEYYENRHNHKMELLDLFIETEGTKREANIAKQKSLEQTPLQSPEQITSSKNNYTFCNYTFNNHTGYDVEITLAFLTIVAGGAGIYIGQNLQR